MKHIILICLIFTGSYFNQAFAQELECGAIQTQANKDFLAKTKEFRNSLNFDNLRAVPHVLPIVAHVIVQDKNNLSGEFSEAEVEQSIAQLNAIFATPPSNSDGEAGSGISFIRCGEINYISETQDYPPDPSNDIDIYPKLHKGDEVKMLSRDFHAAGAINIFYAKELFSGESSICGTATYPGTNSTNLDRIFIANECALNKSTLAHEVGHYLNVLHTYNGNTEEEEDETPELVERPPDGDDFCVPATTTCNCGGDDVGDELCDTPADPHKLEFVIDGETVEYNIRDCSSHELDTPACTFSDSDVAAGCNQEDYMPDHKNIMSANWKECRETFTQGQIDRMLAALQTPARSALLTNTCDCLNSISFSSNHKHKSITYTVKDTINSSANIPGDDNPPVSNVVYNAGKYVVMCPPFLAEYGCTFSILKVVTQMQPI